MEVFFEARIEFAGIMERYGKWVEVDAIPREGEEVCWGMPWTDTVTSVIHYLEENVVIKILDTHFGSGSIALAVDKANRLDKMNLHLTACEIDKEYIDKAIKRISESIKQGTLSF